MHPILATRRRLMLYLLAWTPVLGLLSFVTWGSGMPWWDAAGILAPACVLYAFACLSPWYMGRVLPPRLSNLANVVTSSAAAACAGGLLLLGISRLSAVALDKPAPQSPLLFAMGVLIYLLSVGVHYTALAVEASRAADRRTEEARTLAREAELQSLRFQLNPHFLFNSLHSISALATQDGVRARQMCIGLADFLRSSLGMGQRQSIPLGDELTLARSYLQVEQVRFGPRLQVKEEIAEGCQECAVPPLILQPLVENAVKHGISGLIEGGSIRLAVSRTGGMVSVTLENPFDPDAPHRADLGLGLTHVRRRLEVRYGADALFEAGPQGEVYRVMLRFPCEPSPSSPIAASKRA